jgi:hypothetical protein
MIGQVTIGSSFGGVVRYVLEKDRSEVLDMSGLVSENPIDIVRDFNAIRTNKPNIKNAVWHASISFAYDDKLTREQMICIGKDYLEKMGLNDHQYLMVRHHDTRHDHIHIVINRVGIYGDLADDKWYKNRTAHICDQLEEKYHLTIAKKQRRGKSLANDDIPIKKAAKQKIHLAVTSCLEHGVSDFNKLKSVLKDQGIDLNFHAQSIGRINGVMFRTDGLTIKLLIYTTG